VTDLPGNLLTYFLGAELGHQAVHLLAYLLRLEVANFFRRVNGNIHCLVVADWLARYKLTIIRSTRLKWNSLTGRVWKLFVDCL